MTPKPDLLADLNPEQRAAVTHATGPLLIIAGAGTGKTTVVTRRIAWLIHQGLAQPNEILALTFTDKAAGEMEARVDQLLPYGLTDTRIATFHAFGDQILREHALDLGLPPEFRILASDEQAIFLADRFDDIPEIEELRPTNNPRKFVSLILRAISRAKDELVSPPEYLKVTKRLLKASKNPHDEREARRQVEIAKIYAAYEMFKDEAGVLDFGDQIIRVIDLLKHQPSLLKHYRQHFKYILVDEFQDTNPAQYALVKLVLGKDQNLTVVGDDDQAIFAFRGAAVSNILGFLDDFPKSQRVILHRNYRSTQAILNCAYQLIRHNDPDRLEAKLAINKQLTGLQAGEPATLEWFTHDADEADWLVEAIKELRSSHKLTDIAILVRSNSLVAGMADALGRAHLPYSTSTDRDFPKKPEIGGVISFFNAICHPDDNKSLVKLAFSPYYQIDARWILPFNELAAKSHLSLDSLLADESSPVWATLSQPGRQTMENFYKDIIRFRSEIGQRRSGELLYQFLEERGVLEHDPTEAMQLGLFATFPEERRLEMIQNLAAVFEAIRNYGAAGRDEFALSFVDQLESLLTNVVPPSVDLGPDVDAVRIMTAHAAKGLEFEIVFLPGMTADRFPSRRQGRSLDLPDELIKEQLAAGDQHLAEERRLAYVAVTRAKQQLFLSGSATTGQAKRYKKISPFVMEALGLSETPTPQTRVSPTERIHYFAAAVPVAPAIEFPTHDGVVFLSPAMIETYQRDPYEFYWKYVLRAPVLPSRHLVYGNAVHASIEAYYRLRTQGDQPTVADLLHRYEEAWKSEGFESRTDEARQFAVGQATLKRFWERAEQDSLPDCIEEEFTFTLPGVRVRGRIDAIFPKIGEIRDFKTSAVRNQKDANQKIRDNLPIKIYALAYVKRFGKAPDTLTLDFVDKDLRASMSPTKAILEKTKQTIIDTALAIKAGKFEPNPNNPFKEYE